MNLVYAKQVLEDEYSNCKAFTSFSLMHTFTCGFNKQASLSTYILIPGGNGNEF